MWVIQIDIPYEGMYEVPGMSTDEVIGYLNSTGYNFDQICIRPETELYDPWEFIKEFKK